MGCGNSTQQQQQQQQQQHKQPEKKQKEKPQQQEEKQQQQEEKQEKQQQHQEKQQQQEKQQEKQQEEEEQPQEEEEEEEEKQQEKQKQKEEEVDVGRDWEYSIGIPQIDKQHFYLVSIVLRLEKLHESGLAQATDIVSGLFDYTEYHFKYEEDHMRKNNFPLLDEHIEDHKEFTKLATQNSFEYNFGNTKIAGQYVAFLKNWLIDHIKGCDRNYALWLENPETEPQCCHHDASHVPFLPPGVSSS